MLLFIMELPLRRTCSSGGQSRDDDGIIHREESAVSITDTVASVQNETVVDESNPLEPPVQLYDYIDAEALDALLAHAETNADSEWTVTFAVEDLDVTVTSDGAVLVK